MIYHIALPEEVADTLNELDVAKLADVLQDDEKLNNLKYALSVFRNAYGEAMDNEDFILTSEEEESAYLHEADKCN